MNKYDQVTGKMINALAMPIFSGQESSPTSTPAVLLIIDAAVPGHEILASGALPGTQVVILDANRDGIQQITEILNNYQHLQSVQIVSDGNVGQVRLGNTTLNSTSLANYQTDLASWGKALTDDGDILFYGCKVGQGTEGEQLLLDIAKLTQADVAASTNSTGSEAKHGDWILERQLGSITCGLAITEEAQRDYAFLLGSYGTTDGVYDFTGSLGNADSGGTGFRTFGDKFVVSNVFAQENTSTTPHPVLYADRDQSRQTIVIKAEGGNVCESFTFKDLGLSFKFTDYYETFSTLSLVLKDKAGATIASLNQTATNKTTLTYSTRQLSEFKWDSTFSASGWEGIASIELTYRMGNMFLGVRNIHFENITVANVTPHESDTTPPTITSITRLDTETSNASSVQYTVKFSEDVNGVDADDFTVATSGTSGTISQVTGSGDTYTVTINSITGDGTLRLDLKSADTGIKDISSNTNAIATGYTDGQVYTFDHTAPTVKVSSVRLSDDSGISDSDFLTDTKAQTISGSIDSKLAADETVEVSVNNGSSWNKATVNTDVNTWRLDNVSLKDSGTIKVRVVDAVGNASAATSQEYTVDTTAPTLHSPITISDAELMVGETANVKFIFTEKVSNFTTADLTVSNGKISGLYTSDGGLSWSAVLTPTSDITASSNIIRLDYSGITDLAGNDGVGSSDSTNYTIDTKAPSINSNISISKSTLKLEDTASVSIVFSEAVKDFTTDDITVPSGSLSNLNSIDGITWTATLTPSTETEEALNVLSVNLAGVTDLNGNLGSGTKDSGNYAIDTVRPTLSISASPAKLSSNQTATLSLTFSEDPGSSFTIEDIRVMGGSISNLAGTGMARTATFTPTPGVLSGWAVAFVEAGNFIDAAGNQNNTAFLVEMKITNASPTTSNHTSTMLEDTSYTLTASDFNFIDPDLGSTLQAVQITSLPNDGTLLRGNKPIALNEIIQISDILDGDLRFTPNENDHGKSYSSFGFKVSDGELFSKASANWIVNVTPVNDPATGEVWITGKTNVGQVLTAHNNIVDTDGIGPFTYIWKANDIIIRGASASTYKLAAEDAGKTITVSLSYIDGSQTFEKFDSSKTSVVHSINKAPVGTVNMSGIFKQGETITASQSIKDADGLGIVQYQWFAAGVAIEGANNASLTLSQAQVGKKMSVVASYTDLQGNAERVTSNNSAAVLNVNDAPSGYLEIIGDASVGSVLSLNNQLTDLDGITTIRYQWLVDGVAIRGGSSSKYTVRPSDLGKQISVVASYTDAGGTNEIVYSNTTDDVVGKIKPTGTQIWKPAPSLSPAPVTNLSEELSWANSLLQTNDTQQVLDQQYTDFIESNIVLIGAPLWECSIV